MRRFKEPRKGLRNYIPTPAWRMTTSVKCMIFYDGAVLLLQKKDREGLHPWEFPGGGLEFGEDFKTAAKREVREETGLSIELLDIAGLWSYARTSRHFLTGIIFVAETDKPDVRLSHEHLDYAWVKPECIRQYHLQPSLWRALEELKPVNEKGQALREAFILGFKK